jgi:hypothetical protein
VVAARSWVVLASGCAALTLLMLGPVLGCGFVLGYDMVFTPRQWLAADGFGLGSALPRAVPADGVLSVVTTLVPGALVQKAILVLAVFAAAFGAARLVPADSTVTRLVAATLYAWTAYVAERLFIGHWALVVAYGCLPWVVHAGLRLRHGVLMPAGRHRPARYGAPHAWAALVLASAPAVLAPTGGVLAAGAAVAAGGLRRAPVTLSVAVVLNAPWWVPAVLHPGSAVSDPAAVDAFAARGEGPGGPLVSVLSLGGIWNAETVPGSRSSLLLPAVALLIVVGAGFGWRRLASAWGSGQVAALAVLALAGLVLAVAGSAPGTGAALRWLVDTVPGAGLLRDGQKWVAWWALFAAMTGALAVERLAGLVRRARTAVLVAAAILPLALLPDLAWGGLGRLTPVDYPHDWYAVRDLLAADQRRGDVLVLPFQPYRRFAWNDRRTQFDPATRFLPRHAIVDDALPVPGRTVKGEDPRVDAARDAGSDWAAQAGHGIGWVLVEHGTPGRLDGAALAALPQVYDGEWLTLYRLPGVIADPPRVGPPVAPVLLADTIAIIVVVGALLRRWLPVGTFVPIAETEPKDGRRARTRRNRHFRLGRGWPRRGRSHRDGADQRP